MGKRPDRDGTLYYSNARHRWVVQLPADELTGKRPTRYAQTEREALALKREMEREQHGGRDLTIKQPTLAQFLDIWLAEVVKPNRRASTLDSYSQICRLYIAPTLGRQRLEALTAPLIQRWINSLSVGPATVRNAYARLTAALDIAVSWGYLARNPADGIVLPKLPATEDTAYTLNEAQRLLTAAEGWRLEGLLWALLILGLRKGEALGLAWRDFERRGQTIRVTQQVQLIGGQVVISPAPKTDTSRRTLPLPSGLYQRFCVAWQERQEERVHPSVEWTEHGLIWPCENGNPIWPRNLNTAFAALCKRAQVRQLPVHSLRHTCATLLGEQGEQEVVIAALLGHTAANVTRKYEHVRERLRTALERLERTLEGEQAVSKTKEQ